MVLRDPGLAVIGLRQPCLRACLRGWIVACMSVRVRCRCPHFCALTGWLAGWLARTLGSHCWWQVMLWSIKVD